MHVKHRTTEANNEYFIFSIKSRMDVANVCRQKNRTRLNSKKHWRFNRRSFKLKIIEGTLIGSSELFSLIFRCYRQPRYIPRHFSLELTCCWKLKCSTLSGCILSSFFNFIATIAHRCQNAVNKTF